MVSIPVQLTCCSVGQHIIVQYACIIVYTYVGMCAFLGMYVGMLVLQF